MMRSIVQKTGLIAGLMLACPLIAFAQAESENPSQPTYLVNIDTPEIPMKGKMHLNVDHRPFGSLENISYTNIGLEYGLSSRSALVLRGGGAVRRFSIFGLAPVAHGGREIEAALRVQTKTAGGYRMALQGGILLPDARPEGRLGIGGEALFSKQFGSRTTLFFTPKALFGQTTLITLGGGVEFKVDPNLSVFGDLQGAIVGDNGTNTTTANSIKKEVWGIGVRYNPSAWRNRISLDLGITNGLGRSMGLSVRDGLGGSSAVYFGVSLRP
jgi:hypothetical protein